MSQSFYRRSASSMRILACLMLVLVACPLFAAGSAADRQQAPSADWQEVIPNSRWAEDGVWQKTDANSTEHYAVGPMGMEWVYHERLVPRTHKLLAAYLENPDADLGRQLEVHLKTVQAARGDAKAMSEPGECSIVAELEATAGPLSPGAWGAADGILAGSCSGFVYAEALAQTNLGTCYETCYESGKGISCDEYCSKSGTSDCSSSSYVSVHVPGSFFQERSASNQSCGNGPPTASLGACEEIATRTYEITGSASGGQPPYTPDWRWASGPWCSQSPGGCSDPTGAGPWTRQFTSAGTFGVWFRVVDSGGQSSLESHRTCGVLSPK